MTEPFVLSIRDRDRGGGLRRTLKDDGSARRGNTWIIYIHGHNVTPAVARRQWLLLRRHLRIEGTSRVQTGLYLWPSDPLGNRILDKILYPGNVDTAADAGRALGRHLAEVNRDVVLVGHSLGALVAVTAAKEMGGAGPAGLVLLGAAIRVRDMRDHGEFARPHLAAVEGIVFSPDDRVLQAAFPTGQWLARPFAERGPAVGLTGQPEDRPWRRHKSDLRDHRHYEKPESALFIHHMVIAPTAGRLVAGHRPAEWTPGWRPITTTAAEEFDD